MTQALSARRVAIRSSLGMVARGSQGILLLLAVPMVSSEAGGDLALVLGIAATMNLISNVGIPTLIIRGFRQGASQPFLMALARAYTLASACAGFVSGLTVLVMTYSLSLSICAVLLCTAQSLYSGLEYWAIGSSPRRYDAFLLKGASLQALLSISAPLTLAVSGAIELSLLALTISFVFGGLGFVVFDRIRVRKLVGSSLMFRSWWRTALGLGAATGVIGVLYSVDLFVVRFLAGHYLVDYRLALYAVSFVVALLPLNLFVLADAASGIRIKRKVLIRVAALCAGLCLGGALVLLVVPHYATTGRLLLVLAFLAPARLVTQVQISQLNAQGLQHWVVGIVLGGLASWALAVIFVAYFSQNVFIIAACQAAIEWLVAGMLAFCGMRSSKMPIHSAR